jgi:hypothetical protein
MNSPSCEHEVIALIGSKREEHLVATTDQFGEYRGLGTKADVNGM